jgi:branched-chain amino acid transport system substrate-binding protein
MKSTHSRRGVTATAAVIGLAGAVIASGAAGATTEPAGGDCAGTIKFGAAVSETGRYEREGKDTREGYMLWENWVNDEYGGIKVGDECYNVEVVYYDDESDADRVANLTERLITEDQVDFLLGPYASDLTMGASAISEQHGVIMVEGNGASEAIFERGFENIFGVLTPGGDYTKSALEALSAAGAETVVIAYEDTAFPTSVAEGAERWAEEFGLEVLATESYPEGVTDVSAIMTNFRDLDPDVFIGGGHFNDALLFVRGAEELGFQPGAMIITVGPSNPDFVAELGDSANGVIGPTQWEREMTWEDEYFGTPEEYAQRYEEAYDHEPTYQAAESSATALVLQIAIEQAGSIETDAVRQALLDMDVETFYGPVNFDETGKNAAKPMGFIQIQDGEIRLVGPAEVADAELQYPLGE